jgi:hypothetical protein
MILRPLLTKAHSFRAKEPHRRKISLDFWINSSGK